MENDFLLDEIIEDSLFQTKTSIIEYVVIEEELKQLFEFCLSFQKTTIAEIKHLNDRKKKYLKNPNLIATKSDWVEFSNSDMVQSIEEFILPYWDSILSFFVPSNQLLLVNIFLEKSLKSLCSECCAENNSKAYGGYIINLKQEKKKSKIATYFNYLKNECELNIKFSNEFEYLDKEIREARNFFVHGDWDFAKTSLDKIDINKVFISVSNLFFEIEEAFAVKRNFA